MPDSLPYTLILGGDSYIARNFIRDSAGSSELRVVSRKQTDFPGEILVNDFFSLPLSLFENCSVAINFIGIAHQKRVKKEDYSRINSLLAIHLAEKSKKMGVKQFIQMSTISVYGKAIDIHEQSTPNPDSDYGFSKLAADRAILDMAEPGFAVTIVRPPMVYGKNCPGNFRRITSLVKWQVPLPLRNALEPRDIVFVGNLSAFLKHILGETKSSVYMISDPQSISVREMVELIAHNTGKKLFLFPLPAVFKRFLILILPGVFGRLYNRLTVNDSESKLRTGFVPPFGIPEAIKISLSDE